MEQFENSTLGRRDIGTVVRQSDKRAWDIGTLGQRGRGTIRHWDNGHCDTWTMGQWDNEPMGLSDNRQSDNGAMRQWVNGAMTNARRARAFGKPPSN